MAIIIRWHPAKQSNYSRGRQGRLPIASVHHRMVGWLVGTRRYFTVSSTRPVSTHFGIGHDGQGPPCPQCGPITGARGNLVVDQYVDLADTAYGNGNWHRNAVWALMPQTRHQGRLQPNLFTYSIEHEDGAKAGHGIVTPHVLAASLELDRLLRSGSIERIRAAGVRVGAHGWHTEANARAIVAAIARWPVSPAHYIDHHAIAGPLKPYCWRPWRRDLGFGAWQPKLLAGLAPRPRPSPAAPNVRAFRDDVRVRSTPSLSGRIRHTVPTGTRAHQVGGRITGGAYEVDGRRYTGWLKIDRLGSRHLDPPLYTAAALWSRI